MNNMECDENIRDGEDVADESSLVNFPFSRLSEIPIMNYAFISDAVTILKRFVTMKKFYENFDNCVNSTLEFILVYSNILMKNIDSSQTLLSLLALLKDVVTGMKAVDFQINSADIDEVLILLVKIMESPHQNDIKLEVGNILPDLMKMHNIVKCNKTDLLHLISDICNWLEEKQYMVEFNRLMDSVLKLRGEIKTDMRPIIENLEFQCKKYLDQETDSQMLLQILKCLLTYYKTREECKCVTNTLKEFLYRLCVFMSDPLLRNSTEQLLAILIEELYCTHTLIWPGGRSAILEEIQALPNNYQEWPNVDGSVFFVITYLLFLHSRLLWSYNVIRKCLDHYISGYIVFPQRLLIKALIMLYPLAVDNNAHNIHNGRILLDSLGTCKTLPELLTYHPTQMTWLLANANPTIKKFALMCWLRTQNEDAQILSTLDATKTGFLLVKLFVNYSDTVISSRVLQLIAKLAPEPNLEKTVELTLPLVCSRPTIFAQLLLIRPTIPVDHVEILNLIKAASHSLPYLTQDTTIQATCYYTIRLLSAMKYRPNALLMFCHHFTAVKVLVAVSVAAKDTTSLAALKLLRRLVNDQVTNNIEVSNNVVIQFTQILQGNLPRISAGLKLLQTLLNHGKQALLLNIHKQSLLGLYHFMHALIRQQEIASAAYKILRQLILCENNLAFSLATTHALSLISKKDMDSKSIRSFLEFLEEWLKFAIQYPYIEVPISSLLIFFDEIGLCNDTGHCILQMIAKYQQRQQQL